LHGFLLYLSNCCLSVKIDFTLFSMGVLLAVASVPAAAQQTAIPLKTEYLDSTYRVLPSQAGARYRSETEHADSVVGTVKIYSVATGKLASQQEYANLRRRIPTGVWESWYPSGQLQTHAEYLNGRRVGELRMYHPGGQLKRREVYNLKDDFMSTGECFAENGQSVPFFPFEQMPRYTEGNGSNQVVVRAIQRGVKYPKAALKARCAGQVIVGFNVTAQGGVADIRLIQSVCAAIDEAVLDSVRRLKPFKPGMQDGKPVAVAYTVPVSFVIQ
jgi:protein TonB